MICHHGIISFPQVVAPDALARSSSADIREGICDGGANISEGFQ
jgi:hypothetical protein